MPTSSGHQRFRIEDGRPCIDIRLKSWQQLFDHKDPAPFHERDLDDDAAAYIVSSFRELGRRADAKLVIHLAEKASDSLAPTVFRDAVHAFFANERFLTATRRTTMMRQGRYALGIGLVFLIVCQVTLQLVAGRLGEGTVEKFVREGLTILGWVAMWRPIDILLYSGWPLGEEVEVHTRLADMTVDVRYDAS